MRALRDKDDSGMDSASYPIPVTSVEGYLFSVGLVGGEPEAAKVAPQDR